MEHEYFMKMREVLDKWVNINLSNTDAVPIDPNFIEDLITFYEKTRDEVMKNQLSDALGNLKGIFSGNTDGNQKKE